MRNRLLNYDQPRPGHLPSKIPSGSRTGSAYGFATGDPVNYSDPFGLCKEKNKGNLTQSQKPSDCESFAKYVERVARKSRSTGEFIRQLGEKVAGFPNGIATPVAGRSAVRFGESGFQDKYVDGDGHPARHFTANLVVGFQISGPVSNVAAFIREIPGFGWAGGCKGAACTMQDIRLGMRGATAGEQLYDGTLDMSQLGDWIREQL